MTEDINELKQEIAHLRSLRPPLPKYVRINFAASGRLRFYGSDGSRYSVPATEETDAMRARLEELYAQAEREGK